MVDFSTLIQGWFRQNKRNLPWRGISSPYKIWLSEIILQQTRVDQGMAYYLRFIDAFPTVLDLAQAEEDDVLNLWQGLGYYSRARNMHASARQICVEFGGEFPKKYKDILRLKGVGEYTAAAVASIAYALPHAVVDGNVYRVLSRYLGIDTPIDSGEGKKIFAQVAAEFLDPKNPGDHNQALMELGALVCTPKDPKCGQCPLVDSCVANQENTQSNFPVKRGKTKVVNRFFNYLVFFDGEHTVLKKRTDKGIWQGLYDFVLIEKETAAELTVEDLKVYNPIRFRLDGEFIHILSHQKIQATFWVVEVETIETDEKQVIVPLTEVEDYPLPQLLIRYIKASPLFGAD